MTINFDWSSFTVFVQAIGIIISGLRPSNIRDVAHDVCTAIPEQLACLLGVAIVIAIQPVLRPKKYEQTS